jgi:hypothetical protein
MQKKSHAKGAKAAKERTERVGQSTDFVSPNGDSTPPVPHEKFFASLASFA